jgi:hypothetical protein
LRETLATKGFQEVLQEKVHTLTCVTFFKTARLKLIWSQSRSRALLAGFALPDGRELGIANVHLQAGPNHQDESQRMSQLQSVLSRLNRCRPWCQVVCGDFNSELCEGSALPQVVSDTSLRRVALCGPTYIAKDYAGVLDHIFVGPGLKQRAVLGSDATALSAIIACGLPNAEYPSDHLPVAALFQVERFCNPPPAPRSTALETPVPEAPTSVDAGIRLEWVEISRLSSLSPLSVSKKEFARMLREQRELENAFLAAIGSDAARKLTSWRWQAAEAARSLVQQAVRGALIAARSSNDVEVVGMATSCTSAQVFDPGGYRSDDCSEIVLPTWAGC